MKKRLLLFSIFTIITLNISNAQWVQTNGPGGGQIYCLTVSGTNIYAGTYNGGFFLSTNYGTNWTALNNGLINQYVYAIAVLGTNLFAGTGEGVFRSTNNGTNWTAVNNGLTNYLNIRAFAISGTNIFVGTWSGGGVFLSTNNGINWNEVNVGLTNKNVETFAVSGNNIFAGTPNGVFLTTNNGTTWTATGLTGAVQSLLVSGTNIYAGKTSGVYLSTNNGTIWTAIGLSSESIKSLAVLGTNIFAATSSNGVFISTNNGTNWAPIGFSSETVYSLAVLGTNIFAGTYNNGIFISTNNGTNWTEVNNGLTNLTINTLTSYDLNIFAGTNKGVFLTTNNGTSWTKINNGLTNQYVQELVVSGTNIFAGTSDSGVFLSTNNGTNWTSVNNGLTNLNIQTFAISGTNIFVGTYGGGVFLTTNNGTNWTAINSGLLNLNIWSLIISGTNLFAGTFGSGVFLSTNNGSNWNPVNNGLTNLNVKALAVSGTNIFAGTGNGGVFLSTNNGAFWAEVNNGLTILYIQTLYVSGNNIFAGISSNGIYHSSNNGTNWTQKNQGFIADLSIYSLLIHNNYLYAATSWQSVWRRPLSELISGIGIPVAPVLLTPANNSYNNSLTSILDWNNIPDAINYNLQIALDSNFYSTILNAQNIVNSEYSIPLGLLQNNIKYYWRVNATNTSGTGPWSNPWNFVTIALPPNLLSPPNGAGNVTLTPILDWTEVTYSTSYRCQISTNYNFSSTIYDTIIASSQVNVPSGKLGYQTQYYWRALAINPGGQGNWSEIFNFTTSFSPPPPPQLISPLNSTIGVSLTPIMNWSTIPSATSYRLQISTNSGFTTTVLDTVLSTTAVNIPAGKLLNITQYYWRVASINSAGQGSFCSAWTFITGNNLILNLTVLLEGFWDGFSLVQDTARIYIAGTSSPFTFVDSSIVFLSTTGTATVIFKLPPNGNYYVVLKHRNHLETWSRLSQNFITDIAVNYDFTTDSSKAFGFNMKKVGTKWVLYGGDPNQDGEINAMDIPIFISEFGLTGGYFSCDFNGDGDVNATDVQIIVANFGLTKSIPTIDNYNNSKNYYQNNINKNDKQLNLNKQQETNKKADKQTLKKQF